MTARGRERARSAPARSVEELHVHLQQLASSRARPKAEAVRRVLRVPSEITIGLADVQRIAQTLHEIDPSWQIQLHLATRHFWDTSNSCLRRVSRQVVEDARRISGYPPPAEGVAGRGGRLVDWVADVRGAADRGAMSTPPGLVMLALLPDRDAEFFPDVVVSVLEHWQGQPTLLHNPTRFIQAVAQLVGRGPAGRKSIIQTLTLLRPFRERLARTERERAAVISEHEALIHRRDSLRVELDRISHDLVRTKDDLGRAEGRIAELETALADSQALLEIRAREARTRSEGEIARMKGMIVRRLSHETEEIRRYLQRATPNCEGALARLANVQDLCAELGRQDP